MPSEKITVKRLSTGWHHIRGRGPCNWTQPLNWPTTEDDIRSCAFPQASEAFLDAVVRLNHSAFDPAQDQEET